MSRNFYLPVEHGETIKANDCEGEDRERAVRLYCTSMDRAWSLQVRGTIKRADGRQGKDFIIACASLDKEGMRALRDAIDAMLEGCDETKEDKDASQPAR